MHNHFFVPYYKPVISFVGVNENIHGNRHAEFVITLPAGCGFSAKTYNLRHSRHNLVNMLKRVDRETTAPNGKKFDLPLDHYLVRSYRLLQTALNAFEAK